MKNIAWNIDDKEEKERIVPIIKTINSFFIFNEVIVMEGIENSIMPLRKYEKLFFINSLIMLQGMLNITIIPKMFINVLKE